MRAPHTNAETHPDSMMLALNALVWTIGDEARASRLLALTGLDPATLRAQAGEASTLSAVLGFLESHEPDLVACADAIATTPAALVSARQALDAA